MLKSTRTLLYIFKQQSRCITSESTASDMHQNNFEEEHKKHFIPTTFLQKSVLTIGSAAASIIDPYRADMIACLSETIGQIAVREMLEKMRASEEGRDILKLKPRINSSTVDLEKLKEYPDGTLGKAYSNFLETNRVTPDSRMTVRFVEDLELAYVIQRYREAHDLMHTILQMPTHMLGEVTVKWVEAYQTGLPMCIGGAIFGPVRLKPKHRQLYRKYHLPWAIETGVNAKFLLNLFFERRWEQPLSEIHQEFNINPLVIPK